MNQKHFETLFAHFEELTSSLSAFVYHYGVAEAVLYDTFSDGFAHNDFVHYCITKATKHLKAAQLLLENGYPEDAMVLSRSAYECYISIRSAVETPDVAVENLVQDKIALSSGRAEYAKTNNGKIDFRKIRYKDTGEVKTSPPSIEKLSGLLNTEVSERLHRFIYNFLSEHAHVHMMGSGNYRDGAEYTIDSDEQRGNAVIFCLLFATLTLSAAISFEDVDEDEYEQCKEEISIAAGDLLEHIKAQKIESWLKQEFAKTLRYLGELHT